MILGTILKMDKGRIQIKGPEDKKVDNDGHGITSDRSHSETICVKKRKTTLQY